MSAEIYYFSGTGNSLYVAKEIQKRIPKADLIPIVKLKDLEKIETSAATVGFVFPIHFTTLPKVVKIVIEKMDFRLTNYIFVIATRHGTPCNEMKAKIEKLLKKKGKSLDGFLAVNMASNDPKFKRWHLSAPNEISNFALQIQEKLNLFQQFIANKEKYQVKDTNITFQLNPLLERLAYLIAELSGDGKEDFYANSKCSGCGICEQVCLSQKIKTIRGRPTWQKDRTCFSCYACLNFCPQKSIQIKSGRFFKFYTEENERYIHPQATVSEIAKQKQN